jgi:hypothetical protein
MENNDTASLEISPNPVLREQLGQLQDGFVRVKNDNRKLTHAL